MKLPKHHYIPVLYLNQWVNKDGRLHEFARPDGRTEVEVRPTSPRGTGYQRGLYRLHGVPEDVAENVERKFMAQVDNLAKDALDMLLSDTPYDWTIRSRSAWSRFVNGLLFRNPEQVNAAKHYLEDHWLEKAAYREKEYNQLRGPNDMEFLDFMINAIEHGTMNYTMSQIDNKKIGEFLSRMRWWTLDLTKVGRPLFTSDRPIIMTNGLAHAHSHLVMPLSPTRLFFATNTDDEERKLRSIPQRELVKYANRHVVRRAQRYVWNTGKDELDFVRKHMSVDAALDRQFFKEPPARSSLPSAE